jgi:hypothetical protein
MLVLAGILLGGVYSFARSRTWWGVVICGAAAVIALAASYAWLPR